MLIVSKVRLSNWRNFREVDIPLGPRMFFVGPNASGKSNLLDVFRFLRDVVKPGGGLQKAIDERAGLSKVRCLAARKDPLVRIEVKLREFDEPEDKWTYKIAIRQEPRGKRRPYLEEETIWKRTQCVLDRPLKEDLSDPERLTQTHLEQISLNKDFRPIASFFQSLLYLHLIPQCLRHPDSFAGPEMPGDPFGRNFLEKVAKENIRTRNSRLRKIEEGLRVAVPQFRSLAFVTDEVGKPHLEALYEHWRPHGAKQREDQFSDGTLRLIGLLWSFLESDSLLLLEEPELSLHYAIVRKLAPLIHRLQTQRKRQVIISTHSYELLSDKGIGGEEVVLLSPGAEGSTAKSATDLLEVRALLESGFSVAEAALERTVPTTFQQGRFFE